MSGSIRHFTLAVLLLFILLGLILPGESTQAQGMDPAALIVGSVKDFNRISLWSTREFVLVKDGGKDPLAETTTQADGRYALALPGAFPDTLSVCVERSHFQDYSLRLSPNVL